MLEPVPEDNAGRRWAKIVADGMPCPWCSNPADVMDFAHSPASVALHCPQCGAQFEIHVKASSK